MHLSVASTRSQRTALHASNLRQWRGLNQHQDLLLPMFANELEQRFIDLLWVTEAQEVLTVLDHFELCVRTVDKERDLLSRVFRAAKLLVRAIRKHAIGNRELKSLPVHNVARPM